MRVSGAQTYNSVISDYMDEGGDAARRDSPLHGETLDYPDKKKRGWLP
jgi:hypothetical protein